ncbi:FeoC-like transcriptional regulator [Coxiella endosymbiont of Amblyomma nuttalli]|uniref:FeoC-like transcriptional regulator n=1 Tax=Coxiella endosymbiont of Amblyomma nuttalli TaxID=2749996 RepID=UPI001BABCEE4|nr:FeoC-like transcriptional regulator [Coxiella endosymbiont of Amblyomma nuttalli]QTS84175.1 FeoC like transcriptional regulator [Coxiella endosymbiont of Amblyomma nuttalli]
MLLSIKTFLKERKSADLQELSLYFCSHPDAMRYLLAHWIRKRKICRLTKPKGCNTKCQVCQVQFTEVYQWVE